MTRLKLVAVILMIMWSKAVFAERLDTSTTKHHSHKTQVIPHVTVPPDKILKLAKELSYPDFPQTIDVIAVIAGESDFQVNAFNPEISKINPTRKIPPSVGLMQVQGGSFDIQKNMVEGIGKLRLYYQRFHSKKKAVMAYNVGPENVQRGICQESGEKYWAGFEKHKHKYQLYNQAHHLF